MNDVYGLYFNCLQTFLIFQKIPFFSDYNVPPANPKENHENTHHLPGISKYYGYFFEICDQ